MLKVISFVLLLKLTLLAEGYKQPHIVFIVADDLGWNDVSWRNPNIHTPNLESLAKHGVILNQSYVQAVCTPSRVAFMTGYYPYRVGRQNHVLFPLTPTGVPLRFQFLPEKLREVGYRTHLVGKWHLGYCNLSYTPTMRGFDTFFGFYNGALDYFSHTRSAKRRGPHAKWNEADIDIGFDLRNNTRLAKKYNGVYSTKDIMSALKTHIFIVDSQEKIAVENFKILLTNVTQNLIASFSPEEPMFLFLSFQSVHGPLQVPKVYEDMYSHIKDEKRKRYNGMVTAMDEAVGKIIESLKAYGYWENTLLIFTTDNGGQTIAGGNNWPLRGNKGTMFEGGTRAVTFVHGNLLKKSGYTNDKLFHAVDWFPTILNVAGANPVSDIDGLDQWKTISEDGDGIRKEMIYNIYDLDSPRGAIRIGDLKLIQGFPGKPAGWIAAAENLHAESVQCTVRDENKKNGPNTFRLYNLRTDPTERHNLAKTYPHLVQNMKTRLEELRKIMVPADDPPEDNRGDPKLWNGSFSPGWCFAQ